MTRLALFLCLALAALPARAEPPLVLVDTPPLHSLVARVMQGLGQPGLLVPPGTSPHDFQLRPSDAGRLSQAQVVIWTGPALVPWLSEPIATLADSAAVMAALDSPGWQRLPLRHADDFHLDNFVPDEDDDHGHAEDATDPHAWLDPAVARAWVYLIADLLSQADPGNAAAYRANARAADGELESLRDEMAALLAPVAARPFVVPHDAYQYLEVAFGLRAAGAIALTDASMPGPSHVAALRDVVVTQEVSCVLTDPQTSADWSAVLAEGLDLRTALVDADGTGLTPGPDLYPQMMRAMAQALADCLGPG